MKVYQVGDIFYIRKSPREEKIPVQVVESDVIGFNVGGVDFRYTYYTLLYLSRENLDTVDRYMYTTNLDDVKCIRMPNKEKMKYLLEQ